MVIIELSLNFELVNSIFSVSIHNIDMHLNLIFSGNISDKKFGIYPSQRGFINFKEL